MVAPRTSVVLDFFRSIALVDLTEDGIPREGFQCVLSCIETWARFGKIDYPYATKDLHRLYFPLMGNQRRALAEKRGGALTPPGHKFFVDALREVIISDSAASRLVLTRYRDHASNVIGLSRCYAGGLLNDDPGRVIGLGASMASTTHPIRESRAFGSYLALAAWLRFRNPETALVDLGKAVGVLVGQHAGVRAIHDAVEMGGVDASPPDDTDFLTPETAARILGATWSGKTVEMGPNAALVLRPILGPWGKPEGQLPPAITRRLAAGLGGLVEAGIIEA